MSQHIQNIGFHTLTVLSMGRGPRIQSTHDLAGVMMAYFDFSTDIEFLFPYINAVARDAQLHENPSHIRFTFNDVTCVLHPKRGMASPLDDRDDAKDFMVKLVDFLNDILFRMDQITARHKFFTQTAAIEILKLLPQTNCNECGFKTCMAFAAMLGRQQTIPGRCPHICKPVQEKAVFPIHDAQGNLLSTITLDVDHAQDESALASAKQYIENLEKKVEKLSGIKEEMKDAANQQLPSPLSQREIEVLRMLACGTTNIEIAHSLNISPHTVKSHINHIFNKLGVSSRTQASVWATQNHFI